MIRNDKVWLKHNLKFEGWNLQAHRESPGKLESSNLSRDNLSTSREIGRAHGSFLIRRQRGHPGVVLPLVVSDLVNH